jgi:hypothetical protein
LIISHQHRFIFVKTRKTAGTSVEVLLARIAGDDAVVTPIWPEVDGHVPRNFMRLDNPIRSAVLRRRQQQLTGNDREHLAYFNHISARNIRRRLGRRRWHSYYTFCFDRNPWDKVISEYFWRQGNGKFGGSLRDYVLTSDLPSDFDKYSLDGSTPGVDFVGRYENLEGDLRHALDTIGLRDVDVALTREKGNYRPRTTETDTRFDDDMNGRVAQVFAREIATLGYRAPAEETPPDTTNVASTES